MNHQVTKNPKGASFIALCSFCGDVKAEEGWRSLTEEESYTIRLSAVPLNHGLCRDCKSLYGEQLQQLGEGMHS